jgi:hypothetical protein
MPRPTTGAAIARPRSRTLTAVHSAILDDLVFPTEVVGRRTRYRADGSKLLKVYLDPKDRNTTEYKLDTFAGVYRKLTGSRARARVGREPNAQRGRALTVALDARALQARSARSSSP